MCFQVLPTGVSAGGASPVDIGLETGDGGGTDRVIVKFRDGIAQNLIESINSSFGAYLMNTLGKLYSVAVPEGGTVQALVDLYMATGIVQYAEADGVVHMTGEPDDAYYEEYQASIFDSMSIVPSWELASSGDSVVVAVIDTGADYGHPDLGGNLLSGGYDFVNFDSDPSDDNGHGTFCSGLIAAATDNGIGVAGAGVNCKILPVKALDAEGSGYNSMIAAAVVYAVDHGADVISMSLGGSESSLTLQYAINYAYNAGVVVLAAAGNSGGAVEYPGACDHVIAVGALDPSMEKADYSCYGSALDLTAIGSDVISTFWDAGESCYAIGSGTSFACPFAAALAAMTVGANSGLTPDQVETLMETNADDLGASGRDDYYGAGCVNYYETLADVSSVTPVEKTLTGITASTSYVTVSRGRSVSITVKGTYSDGSTADLTGSCTWNSSWKAVAKVSGGTVTGVNSGLALITAQYGGFTTVTLVRVTTFGRLF